MEQKINYYDCYDCAIACTVCASRVKDWRLTNAKSRKGRELAKRLLLQGGYFLGTQVEAAEMYPDYITVSPYASDTLQEFIWCFATTPKANGRCDIELIPFCEA